MNKNLFASPKPASALIQNEAGGQAYALPARHALAQLVATGTLSQTYYVDATVQLEQVKALCADLDATFIAKAAIYARQTAYMKDMPVLLLAILSGREDGAAALKAAFPKVIDNGKQLRNFVQILRSGAVGRRSLGSLPKKLVGDWLSHASDQQLLSASIGQEPSLADVIRLTHPKPVTREQEAFFAYVIGRPYEVAMLPETVRELLAFHGDATRPIPDVPLQLLMGLGLTREQWALVARRGSWQMVRMNLNTFARYGVFHLPEMVEVIAAKLTDAEAIQRSRVFPYQLLMTWASLDQAVPEAIKKALEQAMELALNHVPVLEGRVVVAVDVSGSMASPVTGYRQGATTKLRCVDATALFAAALKRVNPQVRIMPFDTRLHEEAISWLPVPFLDYFAVKGWQNPPVFELAAFLAGKGGGGTSCALPLAKLNREKAWADTVIYFSDNESWVGAGRPNGTAMMAEWEVLKKRNPNARLICVDVQPYAHTQVQERPDVLNIGGFGDAVFRLIGSFAAGEMHADHWLHEIEQIALLDH